MRVTALVTVALSLLLAAPALADDVRRDPKGQTGISPYNELLAAARTTFKQGNADATVAAFKKAVTSEPDNMYGYLLLAQAQLRADDVKAAHETVKLGRTKKGTEAVQAKMLLLFADLEERHADVPPPGVDKEVKQSTPDVWDLVKQTWSAYAVYLTAHASLPGYQATATERKKQIVERNDRDQKYIAVRQRMVDELKKKK